MGNENLNSALPPTPEVDRQREELQKLASELSKGLEKQENGKVRKVAPDNVLEMPKQKETSEPKAEKEAA